jgi:hypothetical protein
MFTKRLVSTPNLSFVPKLFKLGKDEKYVQNSGWKTQREETTRKTCARWKVNLRVDLREIGWEDVDWIHLTV